MLHEILLSLSGHPSPLLSADSTSSASILSPPEKALLASVAHLSDLHHKLIVQTASVASAHPSSICKAVATAISSVHLAQFQQKVLEVEDDILSKDAGSVGAYNIVPLTAIVKEFSGWTRRMEWFLGIMEFMEIAADQKCTGAMVIDKLCNAIQTGYVDIEEAALSLVRVAETAWLRQISSWILYGRLPSFGKEDFFVQEVEGDDAQDYMGSPELLPAFVSRSTASSLLFIGRSLNYIRAKGVPNAATPELDLLSSHLKQLSMLRIPIDSGSFAQVIASIRLSLSQTTLQKLLPVSRVVEILALLREFFLLGRGEFAMALINEADERMRSRWRRTDNKGYEKKDRFAQIAVKDGEVSAILSRTWAAMGAQQGHHEDEDEDEQLELARDLVQLVITKIDNTPRKSLSSSQTEPKIALTPFRNLLLSVPVVLTLQITSPLDLFLSPKDVKVYENINAYLISMVRSRVRVTDLWKITALRRDHPAPPGAPRGSSKAGRSKTVTLRERGKKRAEAMRAVWATSNGAVFFLGETIAYLQGQIEGTWVGFQEWLADDTETQTSISGDDDDEEDLWLQAGKEAVVVTSKNTHDPQTLAEAHRKYLAALSTNLLLTTASFTDPLYHLLQQVDHLVALVHRIHSIWQSLDLEADEGVVDAFSDFRKEERDVKEQLTLVSSRVKAAIEELVKSLRDIDQDKAGWDSGYEELVLSDEGLYVPAKVGRVDRLLMKLDFGGWFDARKAGDKLGDYSDDEDDE